MLTDIFLNRYETVTIWNNYDEPERRLLVQCFRIISEQLFPYWRGGNEDPSSKARWLSIHDKLSMELGIKELSPKYYSYQTTFNGQPFTHTGVWTLDKVCEDFMYANYSSSISPDHFMKNRISFVELAFREQENEISAINKDLPGKIQAAQTQDKLRSHGMRVPGSRVEGVKATNEYINKSFKASVEELNERLGRAGTKLNYHNGFIQISSDELVEKQVERPFWSAVKDPLWKNVDIDMKEAIDRRDDGDRDPALYAARALESAIKIISSEKGWNHGGETGAHNYIDNLGSKNNDSFISEWERNALKSFFTAVRNPLGHGPGGEKMPELSTQQTNWAIEVCMSWIKSLIQRM